jgi:hypothetical protein
MAFALNPAAAIGGLIDYTTPQGQKLYGFPTKKLDDELFDCNADGLYQFLQSLGNRASEYGWDNDAEGILKIPEDEVDPNAEMFYLVDEYGQLTIE